MQNAEQSCILHVSKDRNIGIFKLPIPDILTFMLARKTADSGRQYKEMNMAERITHKKEQKKAPQKTLKEKRKEKKQNKGKETHIPNS